jgi:hypothetical protein
MRRIFTIALAALLCIISESATPASAQPANVDQTTSDAVTKYLHTHKLPMVGAQVSNTSSGRHLMLYGFVATDFGKKDAETKSKRYLQDSSIAIVNNIRVNPQLRHLKKRPPASYEGGGDEAGNPNAMPPKADWERTFDSTLRAGRATPSNDPSLNMPPPGPGAPAPNFP